MKQEHLKIILACSNPTRSRNMASRVRYQGHKVELVSGGFQTLHEIESETSEINLILFLGDDLEDMGCLEAITHTRVVKNQMQLFIIHVVDDEDDVETSISNGSNIVLTDDNFNKVNEAMAKAAKIFT
jgi:hypothetical protein